MIRSTTFIMLQLQEYQTVDNKYYKKSISYVGFFSVFDNQFYMFRVHVERDCAVMEYWKSMKLRNLACKVLLLVGDSILSFL